VPTCRDFQTVQQGLMRIRILLLLVLFVAAGASALAQEKSGDAAKVLALEKKWTEAYKARDIGILAALLSEDFVITVEDGSRFGKAEYITHSADTSVKVQLAELSDLKVRLHGSVAVVTGTYHEKGESRGKSYEYRDRLTDVWMITAGRWQVIASHYSVPLQQ
jgi:ketosteroid isomerase-like protein